MNWRKAIAPLQNILWIVLFISLPITSFPYFPPGLGGKALVRPLALYPLLLLILLVTLPRVFKEPLPRALLASIPFVAISLLSSSWALFQGVEPFNGVSVFDRVIRAIITLGMGCAFFLTVLVYPRNSRDLNTGLRWLYIGMAGALALGTLQAIYVINFTPQWFDFMSDIQRFFSIRRLFEYRVSGPTYEPHWFAQQIAFLLLPWTLSAVVNRFTLFKWRFRWITVEMLLTAWAIIVLTFTFSRSGLMAMLAIGFLSVLFFFRSQEPKKLKTRSDKKDKAVLRRALRPIGFGLLILSILLVVIFLVGSKNAFFSRLWDFESLGLEVRSFSDYLRVIGLSQRFFYWSAAANIYEAHPVLGVGLGNYTFYFDEYMPDVHLAWFPELLTYIVPERDHNQFVTPKNLYLRLLAETGAFGLAAFLAFVLFIFGRAVYLTLSDDKVQRFWGTAGILGIVAFGIDALTLDSFALPTMWIVFGLVCAAWRVHTASANRIHAQSE